MHIVFHRMPPMSVFLLLSFFFWYEVEQMAPFLPQKSCQGIATANMSGWLIGAILVGLRQKKIRLNLPNNYRQLCIILVRFNQFIDLIFSVYIYIPNFMDKQGTVVPCCLIYFLFLCRPKFALRVSFKYVAVAQVKWKYKGTHTHFQTFKGACGKRPKKIY